MKKHEFYGWYANIPLPKRPIVIPYAITELSPDNCYRAIKRADDKIAEFQASQDNWLRLADLIKKYHENPS